MKSTSLSKPEVSIPLAMSAQASSSKPGQIVIARHGEPDMNRYQRMNWREYERWWAAYDEAGLKPGQTPPESLVAETRNATTLIASTLPRAIETAKACAEGREIALDSQFVEAPLPPPQMPGQFQARTWGVFARCSWWLGHSRGRESRAQVERRADGAAQFLIEAAQAGPVSLFAHGWYNRMLRPALARRGWKCVKDCNDDYWSWRRYELKK
ncbi:phosphoglycerate mutase family protein [Maricaulaceae bacterium NA33B04]|nr:phosphoglycerate mutase family protein [Maricaulaceae bacterium NA33B04]